MKKKKKKKKKDRNHVWSWFVSAFHRQNNNITSWLIVIHSHFFHQSHTHTHTHIHECDRESRYCQSTFTTFHVVLVVHCSSCVRQSIIHPLYSCTSITSTSYCSTPSTYPVVRSTYFRFCTCSITTTSESDLPPPHGLWTDDDRDNIAVTSTS